ncbi:putative ATP-binding cassette, sub-family C [Monocercomonoides exilis]|uniref:putative ATP-binding cassette, sub-family C n=1 Tax=Monocercomonoides exilis TaxID=2049356 RepID=UPI00355A7ECC|nr:putative ATP-binding cassette, sub-family C [Monocercomonoides exilis]|eukprot:MONOS_15003.1-p1 / transcript=MONOS_15003.1 / gene=MONOS_15003 / organism=Monocercomonoides_exilis_PA203 / gene_product=ATP-binding cassette, sub-family C / transcript_product=ATP-binding cassette, sub-family C / location=Mono_scaffold01125:2127-3427(+) / protein_length=378 / sequence_SO=supercontig / SO=protein_coding / is_pseudo=false
MERLFEGKDGLCVPVFYSPSNIHHKSVPPSFQSQIPFIFNDTIESNILFHTSFDPVRYTCVIQACCLEQNLAIVPGGDEAEVGKRGYNLSGGQRMRIALARAVYSSAEVFALDNILASADAHIGQALVAKCISQLLKGKAVLLATHHAKYLPYFDTAIAMEEYGRIRKIGVAEEFKGIVKEMVMMVKEKKEGRKGGGEEEEEEEKKIKDANDIPSPSSSSSSSSPFNLTHSNTSPSPCISPISHSPSLLSSSSSSIIQTPISLSPSPSSSSSSSSSSPSPSPSELGHLKESIDMEADSVSLSSVLWYFKHASFFLLFLALLEIVLSNVAQKGKSTVLNTWTAKDAQMDHMNRTLNGLGGEKRGEEEKKRKINFEPNIE